ncbi:MAG TPA: signal peptidase I [archaeon]|nr:signal peptidase I [archaeon]
MLAVDLIIYLLKSKINLLAFNTLIILILYLAYKIEVKNFHFDFHFRLLNKINNYLHKKFKDNKINNRMERYHSLIERPSFIGLIIPLVVVGIIGFSLYSHIIFLAVVGSGSMEPTFKRNDLILMQNLNTGLENGDIIMFKTPSVLQPVTHRVIDITANGIITKGDAGKFRDDWVVKYDQIMGKAISIDGKPIILKDIGIYFIEDRESAIKISKYGQEFDFIRKLVESVKTFGLLIFFIAIFMYIITSIK